MKPEKENREGGVQRRTTDGRGGGEMEILRRKGNTRDTNYLHSALGKMRHVSRNYLIGFLVIRVFLGIYRSL